MFKKLYFFNSILYLFTMITISLANYWPYEYWWLANLIQISPMWVFAVGWLFLALIAIVLKAKKIMFVHAISFLLILFPIMGFQIPLSLNAYLPTDNKIIRVATIDLGLTVNLDKVEHYIETLKPDVIAFQETFAEHKPFLEKLFDDSEWDLIYEHELALASRIPILSSELVDRTNVGSWGDVAAQFVLQGDPEPVYFYNIWLESPRKGLEAIMANKFEGFTEMKKTTHAQEVESLGVSKWINPKNPVLVTGDFNHLASSPIHRDHWSHLGNAFSDVGFGFGYTKYTSVHGVRLDHFLYNHDWQAIKAKVGPDLEADHRPLHVDFILKTGELPLKRDGLKVKKQKEVKDLNNYFVNEEFESSIGRFKSSQAKQPEFTRRISFSPPGSLLASRPIEEKQYGVSLAFERWPIEQYPNLSFVYSIPVDVPLILRVKTKFNQWVCVARTETADCPEIPDAGVEVLKDTDSWEEIQIDMNQYMKKILPGIKSLKAIEFYFPRNQKSVDFFILDDFKIFG